MESKSGEKQFVLDGIGLAKDQANAAIDGFNKLAAAVDEFSTRKKKGDPTASSYTEVDVARNGLSAIEKNLRAALWAIQAISIAKM